MAIAQAAEPVLVRFEEIVRDAEQEERTPRGRPFRDRNEIWEWTRKHVEQEKISIAEMARRIGYEHSNLSKYLSDALPNPTNIEAALRAYREKHERTASDDRFYETRIARKVMSLCQVVQDGALLGLAYGDPEIGKTAAVKEYCRLQMQRGATDQVAYIQVKCTDTTKSVMDSIAVQLKIRGKGTTPAVMDLIRSDLRRSPRMIVLDDANYLSLKTIEALRWIWDNSGSGLLLMGTKALYYMLIEAQGRVGEELRQFRSRVDVVEQFLGEITIEERRAIARLNHDWLTEEQLDLIESLNYQPRKLSKVLRHTDRLRKANPDASFQTLLDKAQKKTFHA